jgi:ABC-type antimicrobial peptide transport system permease subunit
MRPISKLVSSIFAALALLVTGVDPVVFCGAVASLLVLGVLAASVPASRAARLEPMLALRSE